MIRRSILNSRFHGSRLSNRSFEDSLCRFLHWSTVALPVPALSICRTQPLQLPCGL